MLIVMSDCFSVSDHRLVKCIYPTEVARRVPGCILSNGVDGRKFMSGHSNGSGP